MNGNMLLFFNHQYAGKNSVASAPMQQVISFKEFYLMTSQHWLTQINAVPLLPAVKN
jgi:hypothetical protein